MKKYVKIWMPAVLWAAMMAGSGLAQDAPEDGGVLDGIKAQMTSVVEESARLTEENKSLKAQLMVLQAEVRQYTEDIEAFEPGILDVREVSPAPKIDPTAWNDPDYDPLVQEAQDIYVSGQFMSLSPLQKLRELQLYDLQYEKQELMLDIKEAQLLQEKINDRRDPEFDGLRQEIKASQDKINELSDRVIQEQKAAMIYPQQIELLKVENKALKKRIKRLKQLSR